MGKSQTANDAIYDARSLGTPKMLILGLQHMFAMFGATVLVPALTGLDVATTLLFAGLGTLLFHFITGRKVPAFLGSSSHSSVAMLLSPRMEILPFSLMPASVWQLPVSCTLFWLPSSKHSV